MEESSHSNKQNKQDSPKQKCGTKLKAGKFRRLAKSLYEWFMRALEAKEEIDNEALLVQARRIGAEMGDTRMKYSLRWLDCFKKRHNISTFKSAGISASPYLTCTHPPMIDYMTEPMKAKRKPRKRDRSKRGKSKKSGKGRRKDQMSPTNNSNSEQATVLDDNDRAHDVSPLNEFMKNVSQIKQEPGVKLEVIHGSVVTSDEAQSSLLEVISFVKTNETLRNNYLDTLQRLLGVIQHWESSGKHVEEENDTQYNLNATKQSSMNDSDEDISMDRIDSLEDNATIHMVDNDENDSTSNDSFNDELSLHDTTVPTPDMPDDVNVQLQEENLVTLVTTTTQDISGSITHKSNLSRPVMPVAINKYESNPEEEMESFNTTESCLENSDNKVSFTNEAACTIRGFTEFSPSSILDDQKSAPRSHDLESPSNIQPSEAPNVLSQDNTDNVSDTKQVVLAETTGQDEYEFTSVCDKSSEGIKSSDVMQPSLKFHIRRGKRIKTPNSSARVHVCEVCETGFMTAVYLKKHMVYHSSEKPHVCGECGKCFSHRDNLRNHKNYMHNSNPKQFICNICGKALKSGSSLNNHMDKHAGKKPFSCDYCGRTFGTKHNAQSHMQIHTGEKPFICEFCGKRFQAKRYCDVHRRIHTGEKPYECKECGKRFRHSKTFTEHVELHKNLRPYKCDTCGLAFNAKNYLKNHQVIHTGERPHVCPVCNKAFAHTGALYKHKKMHMTTQMDK